MSNDFLSTEEEFDLSDAGVPTIKGAVTTITGAESQEKQNGTQHSLTFEVEGLSFPITKGYWIRHTNPKAQNAGRGQLKRIAKSATGATTYTLGALVGQRLKADVGEDGNGFAEISNFQPLSPSTN